MKKTIFGMLAAGILLAGSFGFSQEVVKAESSESTIAQGVYIGSVDVGGMTESAAKDAMDAYVNGLMDTTFTFVGPNGTLDATAADMGISLDADTAVEKALTVAHTGNLINRYKENCDLKESNISIDIKLGVDKQATAMLLYQAADSLNIKAQDSSLKRENGEFIFISGAKGNEVDIVSSVNAIDSFLANEWDGSNNTLTLVSNEVAPRGTAEDLAMIKDLLGTYTTDFSTSGSQRRTNVTNGCSKVNGTILFPGEVFSVYDTVSPFTAENGYEEAGSYENGKTVQTFGGGICQVSTTLYNAIIRAELDVTMRYNHSMIVSYVDPSADAAIASGLKDFQFMNNKDYPIYIEGYCANSQITFNVFGVETRDANRKVSFESETLEETDPTPVFNFSSEDVAGTYRVEQSAHKGIKARLWKIVTVDGVEQSRDIFNSSTYKPSPKYVTIGTKGVSKKAMKAIKKAIAALEKEEGTEDAVRAAVAASAEDSSTDDEDKKDKEEEDEDEEMEEEEDIVDDNAGIEEIPVAPTPDVNETPVEIPEAPVPEASQEVVLP